MKERNVETYLKRRVEGEGGLCRKWTSPGRRGVNDQIVIFPGGRVSFVEVKKPGEKAKPHQVREHKRLRAQGCTVLVVDTCEAVDEFIKWRTS